MENILTHLHLYLIGFGLILMMSVFASKITEKVGVPLLLVFLVFGMLLGSDGIVGIDYDDVSLTQVVGTIALILILYSGGLETRYDDIRRVAGRGIVLATLGVLVTALVMAAFVWLVLDFSVLESLLLGSIVSSTDAAAVFMILRGQKIALRNNIDKLLELESGSNDPMAIFLTVMVLEFISLPAAPSAADWLVRFALQFVIGGALGVTFGMLFPQLCHRAKLMQSGLYPLVSIAWLLFMFGVTTLLGGNGYLALYIAGILTNRSEFPHKETILAFHNALAWMMQIAVFLVLGLLVFPSQLPKVAVPAIFLAFVLIFVARPAAVFLGLAGSSYTRREKLFISWVGLRGAVPIILATYPYIYHLQSANIIFDMVFFTVLVSVLLQGMTIPAMARRLGVAAPPAKAAAAATPVFSQIEARLREAAAARSGTPVFSQIAARLREAAEKRSRPSA